MGKRAGYTVVEEINSDRIILGRGWEVWPLNYTIGERKGRKVWA